MNLITVKDFEHGHLKMASAPFSLELQPDGSWAGELSEALAPIFTRGLSWPRMLLKLQLSQGRYSLGAVYRGFKESKTPKNDRPTYAVWAQQRLEEGELSTLCQLKIEDAQPGAKLTGVFCFEAQ